MPRRLIAVGDIHGHLDKLERLIDQIKPDILTELVFLGDYVAYGPDSKGVIDYLLYLREKVRCTFLKGDADALFLRATTLEDLPVFQFTRRGGDAVWRSYGGCQNTVPKSHISFLVSLQTHHQNGEFFFAHAGVRPGVPIEKQRAVDLYSIRDEFLYQENTTGLTVVVGHTPTKKPRRTRDNKIFVDAGAAWPHYQGYGRLAACDVRSGQFFLA